MKRSLYIRWNVWTKLSILTLELSSWMHSNHYSSLKRLQRLQIADIYLCFCVCVYCCSTKGAKQLLKPNFSLEQKTGVGVRGAYTMPCDWTHLMGKWGRLPSISKYRLLLPHPSLCDVCRGLEENAAGEEATLSSERCEAGRTEAESQDVSPAKNCLWLVKIQGAVLRGRQSVLSACWRRWMFRPHLSCFLACRESTFLCPGGRVSSIAAPFQEGKNDPTYRKNSPQNSAFSFQPDLEIS